ncbi:MAG: ABC transporter permease [Myxococcota bacterium]|nr:ABC transporter permease [Myxococcota bacterium]
MNRFWALVRKELLEIVGDRKSRQSGLVQGAVFIGLLGVFVPGANTPYWVEDSPATPLFYAFLPGIAAASIAADAFAGERERQTLETLLATPLSEATIVYGKAFAAIAYGVAIAACGLAVSIVTLNVGAWPYVPSLAMLIGALGAALASALVMASVAIVVSMTIPVARTAHQISWIGSVAILSAGLGLWNALGLALTWRNVAFAEVGFALIGVIVFDIARMLFRRERFFEVT